MKRTHALICLSAVIILVLGTLPAQAQQSDDALLKQVQIREKLGEKIPADLPFQNSAGESVKLGDYLGEKPLVLIPVYYECPMLCSLVLNGFLETVQRLKFRIGEDFNVLTFSFDPGETPELAAAKKESYLKAYGRPVEKPSAWEFLTGSEKSIQELTSAIGFEYAYDPERDEYAHGAVFMVLTPDGTLSRYLAGLSVAPRDLRLALVESADRKIGTWKDIALLTCFHYNPLTGKYAFLIENVLRAACVLTVIILFGFIFMSLKKERHRPNTTHQEPAA